LRVLAKAVWPVYSTTVFLPRALPVFKNLLEVKPDV
jgi:hypothetical protein